MNGPLSPEESYVCADCRNVFLQPPRCTTCGAEKLYDATVRGQAETIEHLRRELRTAQNILIDAKNFIGPATVWRDEELMLRNIERFLERTR